MTRVLVLLGVVLVAVGCGGSGPSDPGATDSGLSDAGAAGDGGVCDGTATPAENPCVLTEAFGVFVSASRGSSSGDGTRERPLASLSAALVAARPTHKRVYACAEEYAEALTLSSGDAVFGGLDCDTTWRPGPLRARVRAPSSPAVTARQLSSRTVLDSVELIAPDATTPGASSVGLLAVDAAALELAHCRVEGGKGADGAPGMNGAQLANSPGGEGEEASGFVACATSAAACNTFNMFNHRGGGPNVCVGAEPLAGGAGGAGGFSGRYLVDTQVGAAWVVDSSFPRTDGAPATVETAAGGTSAAPAAAGADGASGEDGTSGQAVGAFSESGYAPSNGTPGNRGHPGQGGGGGAGILPPASSLPFLMPGSYFYGFAGGGGGAGGCPGLPSIPGGGGGASVGVLAVRSALRITDSELAAGTGGAGGETGLGSLPTEGFPGGAAMMGGQPGGPGGRGGYAGASGNGGGGPSIALVSDAQRPRLAADVVLTPGVGGAGVPVRLGPASPAGLSAPSYRF